MKEMSIKAKTDNLPYVSRFVDNITDMLCFEAKSQTQINIAVDEIFSNIAQYAYAPQTGDVKVQVNVGENPRNIAITFIDSGVRYNPLEKKDPDISLSAEERNIGGLGIYIVKEIMDEVSYEYLNGQNVLTIKKYF